MKLNRRNIITVQKAEKLMEKYYEGSTTVAEENQLRTFLAQSNVPPQFEAEKTIFGYYESKKEIVAVNHMFNYIICFAFGYCFFCSDQRKSRFCHRGSFQIFGSMLPSDGHGHFGRSGAAGRTHE